MNETDIAWKLAQEVANEVHGRYGIRVYINVARGEVYSQIRIGFLWDGQHWETDVDPYNLIENEYMRRLKLEILRVIDNATRQMAMVERRQGLVQKV